MQLIAIVSPVTRRELIHEGSTATSMSPTVTGASMAIYTSAQPFRHLKGHF
ncbi:hypothetical protein [Shewanella acanthi]|uniref:hypothetical protein n=1 Tax=Shewanella acanthi TaxID=2864212 RepID=UPI001C6573D3|nr:hypothetical protein [Shewanella acanthi]QYJ78259.1 hypothetical protein K0H61_14275 [Shewanella acanthi]